MHGYLESLIFSFSRETVTVGNSSSQQKLLSCRNYKRDLKRSILLTQVLFNQIEYGRKIGPEQSYRIRKYKIIQSGIIFLISQKSEYMHMKKEDLRASTS